MRRLLICSSESSAGDGNPRLRMLQHERQWRWREKGEHSWQARTRTWGQQCYVGFKLQSTSTPQDICSLQTCNQRSQSLRRGLHCFNANALLDALPALASTRSMSALRAGHSLQFPLCSSSRHQSSFLCHTIPIWNNLPSSRCLLALFVSL